MMWLPQGTIASGAQRMEQAAHLAELHSELTVAEVIRVEIYAYAGTGVLIDYDLTHVLDYVESRLLKHRSLTCSELVNSVGKFFGVSSRKVHQDFGREIAEEIGGWG